MNEIANRSLVRIHIDREKYESPNPTTGIALYTLAEIPPNRELFREVSGDNEDELIPRGDEKIRLHDDDHFYSQKDVVIVVNGERKEVTKTLLSFDDLVKLAFPKPPTGENILFTIVYRKGPPANPKGTLLEGQSVKIKKGMIFDVTPTDRS